MTPGSDKTLKLSTALQLKTGTGNDITNSPSKINTHKELMIEV